MVDVSKLASYISYRYAHENNGAEIDEMKMHKLLYFAQRESLIQANEPLFVEDFQAWKFGPVLPVIRNIYINNALCDIPQAKLNDEQTQIMDYVFKQYSQNDSWSLSRLTHGEYSWQNARNGISEYDNCDELISLEDIKVDAEKQSQRRKALKELRELGLLEQNN